MKKIIGMFLGLSFMFAANAAKFGLDVSLAGDYGFQTINYFTSVGNFVEQKDGDFNFELTREDFFGGLEVSSYDFFCVDDMFGAFAIVSVSFGGFLNEVLAGEVSPNDGGMNEATLQWEFLIGPAFGIDMGSPFLRFQTGLGFHFLGGNTVTEGVTGYENCPEKFVMMGIGLTPQIRVGNNKRVCFTASCGFIFDFAYFSSRKQFWYTDDAVNIEFDNADDYDIKKFFRFGLRPSFGVGINF